MPEEESLWEGCFVFDDRVTLSHGLEQNIVNVQELWASI